MHLELTNDEAQFLADLLNRVSGGVDTHAKPLGDIRCRLAHVHCKSAMLCNDISGEISFKSPPKAVYVGEYWTVNRNGCHKVVYTSKRIGNTIETVAIGYGASYNVGDVTSYTLDEFVKHVTLDFKEVK